MAGTCLILFISPQRFDFLVMTIFDYFSYVDIVGPNFKIEVCSKVVIQCVHKSSSIVLV